MEETTGTQGEETPPAVNEGEVITPPAAPEVAPEVAQKALEDTVSLLKGHLNKTVRLANMPVSFKQDLASHLSEIACQLLKLPTLCEAAGDLESAVKAAFEKSSGFLAASEVAEELGGKVSEKTYNRLLGMFKESKDCPKETSEVRLHLKASFEVGEGAKRGRPSSGTGNNPDDAYIDRKFPEAPARVYYTTWWEAFKTSGPKKLREALTEVELTSQFYAAGKDGVGGRGPAFFKRCEAEKLIASGEARSYLRLWAAKQVIKNEAGEEIPRFVKVTAGE